MHQRSVRRSIVLGIAIDSFTGLILALVINTKKPTINIL